MIVIYEEELLNYFCRYIFYFCHIIIFSIAIQIEKNIEF